MGGIALLAGPLYPRDWVGIHLILPGSVLAVLGISLAKGQRGMIRYWIWVSSLIAMSMATMTAMFALGRVGGQTLRRLGYWADIIIIVLPYALGWILGAIGLLVMLVRFLRSQMMDLHIIPSGLSRRRLILGCLVAGMIAGAGGWILTRGLGIAAAPKVPANMVLIPAGSFTMGNTLGDESPPGREIPTHTVTVCAFYLGIATW